MPTFRCTLAGVALAVAGVFAVGCSSTDRHVFVSPPTRPATVSVIEAQQHKTLWSLPVPAGEKLLVNLQRNGTSTPLNSQATPADSLTWQLFPGDTSGVVKHWPWDEPIDQGQRTLPGTPVLLKVKYAQPKPPTRPASEERNGPQAGGTGNGAQPGPVPAAQSTPPGAGKGEGRMPQSPNGPPPSRQGQPQGEQQGQRRGSGRGQVQGQGATQPAPPASPTAGQRPPRQSGQGGSPSASPASESQPKQNVGNAPTSPPPSPGANPPSSSSPAGNANGGQQNQPNNQNNTADQNDQDMMFK